MGKRFTSLDDRTSEFVDQRFNEKMKETYELPRQNLKAITLIPVVPANRGAKTVSHKVLTEFGMAMIIASYARDLPSVGRSIKEYFVKIFTVGTSYGYSLEDLNAAMFAGEPLDSDLNSTAKFFVETEEDRIAFEGDEDHDIVGFINHPNITAVTIADSASGKTEFLNKTVEEIIADHKNIIVNGIQIPTKEIENPDTIIYPTDVYADISTRPFSKDGSVTLLDYLKKVFPQITKWDSVSQLAGVGVGDTNRMMAYTRKTSHVCQVVPVTFEQRPVQNIGLQFDVPCIGRTGGTIIKRPLSVAFMDGV